MPKIRWVEDFGEYADEHCWLGYLGKKLLFEINYRYDVMFYLNISCSEYTKLSSAKRGAERMLDKFLKDAGLEVKR